MMYHNYVTDNKSETKYIWKCADIKKEWQPPLKLSISSGEWNSYFYIKL